LADLIGPGETDQKSTVYFREDRWMWRLLKYIFSNYEEMSGSRKVLFSFLGNSPFSQQLLSGLAWVNYMHNTVLLFNVH